MARPAVTLLALLCALSSFAGQLSVGLNAPITPGMHEVTLSVYASRDGGTPLMTETRTINVEANGSFTTPLGLLGSGSEPRWLEVRIGNAKGRRIQLDAHMPPNIGVEVVNNAISAQGFVQSSSGFRFPDASVQTTAATIAYGSPVAVGSANADGAATTLARSDHVHAHGNQAGGSLHSAATTGTAGFMSASDKTKLDATVAYARTFVVSATAGDPTTSGTTLTTTLAGITGSASSPALLKLEPGVYDVGTNGLTMKTYVDIEGSGENVTFINASRGSGSVATATAITGATNSEIRNLTISNTSSSTFGVGYFITGSSVTASMRDVTINSTGGTSISYCVFVASNATLNISRCTFTPTASGTGTSIGVNGSTGTTTDIRNSIITAKSASGNAGGIAVETTSSSGTMTVNSSTIKSTGGGNANTGVFAGPGTITVTDCTIKVDTAASRSCVSTSASVSSVIAVSHSLLIAGGGVSSSAVAATKGANSTLKIGTTMLDSASNGTPKCVHVYSDDFDDLLNVCPAPAG